MPLPSEILEQVDELYRDHASLKDFESVADLAKSYVETKAMVGNSIRIPSKDAGPEAYQEYLNKIINNDSSLMMKPDFSVKDQKRDFYRTIGLPEDESKYSLPEGVKLTSEVDAEIRKIAYENNLTDSQFGGFMTAFSDRQEQASTLNTEMVKSDMAGIKEKWGMAFDDRIAAAKQANEEFYPGRDFDNLTAKERESLYRISKAMTGKGAPAAGDAGGIPKNLMTPEEAKTRADELLRRAQNAKPNEMTREEIKALVDKSIELRVKYAGYEGSLDSLRA